MDGRFEEEETYEAVGREEEGKEVAGREEGRGGGGKAVVMA
jgi:hypothetical protein